MQALGTRRALSKRRGQSQLNLFDYDSYFLPQKSPIFPPSLIILVIIKAIYHSPRPEPDDSSVRYGKSTIQGSDWRT